MHSFLELLLDPALTTGVYFIISNITVHVPTMIYQITSTHILRMTILNESIILFIRFGPGEGQTLWTEKKIFF